MLRYVTVITAREVLIFKMEYHGDKFLLIGAVTIVNNRDHTLHYANEEEIKSRTLQLCSRLLRSAVLIISKGLFLYKGYKHALHCMVSVADIDRTKKMC